MRCNILPVFLAFVAIGFSDCVGPFCTLRRTKFRLSSTAAALIPFVGLSMFGLFSVPTGILQKQYGKKFAFILGLSAALAES